MQLFNKLFTSTYYQRNKALIIPLSLWLFRICFLLQGNEGGVAINKFVLFQIFMIIIIFMNLCKVNFLPILLIRYSSTSGFALIYILGMASMLWSVLPLMSCFFAFENLVCMTVLLYLAQQCKDQFQLERIFIWSVISIICMFIIRNVTIGGTWHSVTYSTIAAMLTTYCLGEYNVKNRPDENVKMLRYGLASGIFILIITTSGGAMFSTAISLFALSLFAEKPAVRVFAFISIMILVIMWFSGATDKVLDILFPGKSMASIMSAHGRTVVWDMINEKVAERPILGWGYAAVERILPIYCVDAHNSIVGIRGSLGNVGCGLLIITMVMLMVDFYKNNTHFGYRGLMISTLCAFINSNTTNFLAAKAGPCALTFQFLLILGASYIEIGRRNGLNIYG